MRCPGLHVDEEDARVERVEGLAAGDRREGEALRAGLRGGGVLQRAVQLCSAAVQLAVQLQGGRVLKLFSKELLQLLVVVARTTQISAAFHEKS